MAALTSAANLQLERSLALLQEQCACAAETTGELSEATASPPPSAPAGGGAATAHENAPLQLQAPEPLPRLALAPIHVQPVSPADGATPRSALSTAFSLLRQTSTDLAAEAAAVAEAVASSLAAQHESTMQALGLAGPESVGTVGTLQASGST